MENITTAESNTETAQVESQPAKPEVISVEAELARVASEKARHEERLDVIARSRADTAARLAAAREKMGLPPLEETPPSLAAYDDQAEKIKKAQESLKTREQSLVSEQEKEKLVAAEKIRLVNEEIAELKKQFLMLDQATQSSILTTGRIPEGALFHLPSGMNASNPEDFKIFLAQVLQEETITEDDLAKDPEVFKAIEETAEEVATEHVDTALEHLEKGGSPDLLTDTDREILREADELLIGYEGGAYTPESLIARVEEQNKEAEIKETTARAAQSYDSSLQSN